MPRVAAVTEFGHNKLSTKETSMLRATGDQSLARKQALGRRLLTTPDAGHQLDRFHADAVAS
jgi:hypothetical protein